jgi:hypothetical protein
MGDEGETMTLELTKVTDQIEEVGRVLATGAERRQKALPALRGLRRLFAHEKGRMQDLAESAVGREMNCALPTQEALNATFPAPEPPVQATILAADGSQIDPDPHGWVLYYLINIGSLVYRQGSGRAPDAASEPRLAYAVDNAGVPMAAERLDARRDVAELQKLAEMAEAEPEGDLLVALLDSTIGLRAWSGNIPQAEQEMLQQSYAAHLERLRLTGVALAGVVSRSRRAGVVSLLDLARQEEPATDMPAISPFLGITDQMLWGDLKPGERSALFVEQGKSPVCFFYLNTTPPDTLQIAEVEAEPARIELPDWVALSNDKVGLVHALVYDQCRMNNGYPYALTRADELAVILNEEREALETMILQAVSRHGMPIPRFSHKAAQKRIARGQFRRR